MAATAQNAMEPLRNPEKQKDEDAEEEERELTPSISCPIGRAASISVGSATDSTLQEAWLATWLATVVPTTTSVWVCQ